jgi:hypothetical protein
VQKNAQPFESSGYKRRTPLPLGMGCTALSDLKKQKGPDFSSPKRSSGPSLTCVAKYSPAPMSVQEMTLHVLHVCPC